ncbi:MAG TPA: hypothetical protein VGR63_18930 [Casimicrobiaceae bacterium]|nr:hypothetical protein [Casimicrobiaceae bacterium]
MMLPPDLRRLLDGCGLPWRIEEGARHRKVIVDGRFISILPKSNSNLRNGTWRTHRNSMAHIRRGIREVMEQER